MKIADLFATLRLQMDANSIKTADALLGGIKKGLIALAAYASVRWAKGLIDQTVELGGKLSDLSQQLGIPAETLQQLGYAASQSGSSLEGMSSALRILQRNAFAASKGSEEQAKGFRELGVRLRGANGQLRPTADLLADVADKIKIAPDSEKAALAMKAFGRSGATLVPLLNEGSAGIAKLRQEFVDLGGQIDEKNVAALEAFGDEQDKVGVAMSGLRNEAVIALLPTLREITAGFLEWFKANRALIRQRLAATFKILGAVLKVVAAALKHLFNVFGWIIDHSALIVLAITSISVALVIMRARAIAAGIASMAAAAKAAIAWAIAALPFLALVAAVALAILIIDDLYSWITGGESVLKDAWSAVIKALPDSWQHAIGAMKLIFSDFADFVRDGIAGLTEMLKDYNSAQNRQALREEGKARGLKGKELDQFVEQGVANEITGNAAGVDKGMIKGRAGATALDYTSLGRMFYSAKQQELTPAAMRFAPPMAQAAAGAGAVFQPVFNITPPAGSDEKKVAEFAKTAFTSFFTEQMQRGKAGAGK